MIKRLTRFFALSALLALPLSAQDLSPAEKERAADYLQQTKNAVVDAVEGLSAEQWSYQPAPGRWSVAQVVEHLAAAEAFLLQNVTEQVMKAPPREEPVNLEEIDTLIIQGIPDRSRRFQAPEPLLPANQFGSPAQALEAFQQRRAQTQRFLEETDDLRAHATDSPLGQKLDAYQWLLFIGAHSERHLKQIEEVQADPAFPE